MWSSLVNQPASISGWLTPVTVVECSLDQLLVLWCSRTSSPFLWVRMPDGFPGSSCMLSASLCFGLVCIVSSNEGPRRKYTTRLPLCTLFGGGPTVGSGATVQTFFLVEWMVASLLFGSPCSPREGSVPYSTSSIFIPPVGLWKALSGCVCFLLTVWTSVSKLVYSRSASFFFDVGRCFSLAVTDFHISSYIGRCVLTAIACCFYEGSLETTPSTGSRIYIGRRDLPFRIFTFSPTPLKN